MKIHDITLTITPDLTVWPGDPAIISERVDKIEEGSNANVSRIDMGVHTGTHVDAPYHFIPSGYKVESLPLDVLIGKVWVADIAVEGSEITREDLTAAEIPPQAERVLLKTRNSTYWEEGLTDFQTGFSGVTRDGAEYLVEMGIKLIGIDYLSISPYKKSRPTHEVLLGAQMVVLEGVNLSGITPGWYTLYCLPLKLGGSDGAPARAVLIDEAD